MPSSDAKPRGLRIVGGSHRGRRLVAPPGELVRPTSDRAREALFNILSHGNFAASGLPFAGRPVLDAFAGTGALGLADRAHIVAGDATRPPRAAFACALAFLDPPYHSGAAAPSLLALAAAGWLTPDALIVIEVAARDRK